MPLFSIIVPVYNKEKTLARCIDSVLQQKCCDWELLLINDGSRDESEKVIKKYNDSRIKSLEHENHGVSYTRNRGIREAQGDFLIFLDADDYWGEGYLEIIRNNVQICADADIYLTGLTKVMVDGKTFEYFFPYDGCVNKDLMLRDFYTLQRTTQLYGYVSNKILRRSFILQQGIFFDEMVKQSEDMEFFLRCYALCNSFYYIRESRYYYIRYESGTSKYYRNVDYFSLLEILKRVKQFCGSNMTVDDMIDYEHQVQNLAHAAVAEISPWKVYTIFNVTRRINTDPEIYRYYAIRENIVWLMCKVFIHQLYVRLAQKILKICRK